MGPDERDCGVIETVARRCPAPVWRSGGTILLLVCAGVVYGAQLAAVGPTAETAAFRVATALAEWNANVFTLLSPL